MGNRSARLTDIPPNTQREVRLECVPISRTASVELPRVRVWEGIGEGRREVGVIGEGVGKGGIVSVVVLP